MASSGKTYKLMVTCLTLLFFYKSCQSADIQIEDSDGSRHVFKMKSVEKNGAYLLCANCNSFTSGALPTPTALRFSVRFTPVGEFITACETHRKELPVGLCSPQPMDTNGSCSSSEICLTSVSQEELAKEIVRRKLLPFSSGDVDTDYLVAHAIVELNTGQWNYALDTLSVILLKYPANLAAHYARGVAYARNASENQQLALLAIADFTVCIEKEPNNPEGFERRAEVYITASMFKEALADVNTALRMRPNNRLQFSSGIINLLLENFAQAETEFRKNLENDQTEKGHVFIMSYFHLGLAQYYRGRLRNAIEVFKEVLKLQPDHVEACVSLAQAFRELGNAKAARTRFDQALSMNPNHTLSLQLKGSLLYHSGDPSSALAILKQCLKVDPDNNSCQYLSALSSIALGHFYQGVKFSTKVMIKSLPEMKISPERVRAQYIREYARYLHANLDSTLTQLQPEVDLDDKLKSMWVQGLPLTLRSQGSYQEQPGLQPEIPDVQVERNGDWLPANTQTLLCQADRLGLLMQVSVDGFLPNRRLNLALGLAALHIAQLAEAKWRNVKTTGKTEQPYTWKELFSIALHYRQLVDPEQAVFWVSALPDYQSELGYREDTVLIRGSVINARFSQYFDLTFRLAKTMLEHYTGGDSVSYSNLPSDIEKATTCEELLEIARKRNINPHGFLVSTQVPAAVLAKGGFIQASSSDDRLEGAVLVLAEDPNSRVVLALSVPSTPSRTAAFAAQMDHFLLQLHHEVQKTGSGKLADMDPVLSAILSLAYYFYNLTPLTRGSSSVAYAVVMGLIMSFGRQVTGKIPNGKLLNMEAILSGAPDVFIAIMRQWLNVKKATMPLSNVPKVWETLPSVRSVLEVLAVNTTAVCS